MQEQSLFIEALEKEDPAERAAFLDRACAADPALRERIERLLHRHREQADDLLEFADPWAQTGDRPVAEGAGSLVGPYKLLEEIGEGGMGVVFMAEQGQPVRRRVALKVIKPGMDTKQVVARFEAERQALALMDHPNIAHVLDAGATESGRPYFVMELVHGIPITEYCDRERLSVPERLGLFVLVCRAVQHAHQKGVIHRDLKPSNVLVTMIDGAAVPKVIDFGVAKATGASLTDRTLFTGFHQFVGTPLYMSPEQAALSGQDMDTRSDIYSLGVLLYELLTGTTPFDGETFRRAALDEVRRIIREDEPPRPSTRLSSLGETRAKVSAKRGSEARHLDRTVRGELDWIVMKALEKDRRRRYETANDFAADVMRHLADEPVEACPPSAGYRLAKFARRNRTSLIAGGIVAVALVSATIISTWQAVVAVRARRESSKALATARRAVDEMYTQVAEKWLAQQPKLTPVQSEFLEKALAFYQQFAAERGGDLKAGLDAVRARKRVAMIEAALGRNDRAEASYRVMLEELEDFSALHPDDADCRDELAWTLAELGVVCSKHNRFREAEALARRSIAVREALIVRAPGNRRYRNRLAATLHNLGVTVSGQGREADAETAFRRARDIYTLLHAEAPRDAEITSGLAQAEDSLGRHWYQAGRRPDAKQALWRSLRLREELLAADPKNPDHRIQMVTGLINLNSAVAGDPGINDRDRRAIELLAELVTEFPDRPRYREVLVINQINYAIDLRGLDRMDEARQVLRSAIESAERLAADFPERPDHRSQLAHGLQVQAIFQMESGELDEAKETNRRARDTLEGLLIESPGHPDYRQKLAGCCVNLAEWLLRSPDAKSRDAEGAVALTRRACELSPQDQLNWKWGGLAEYCIGDWDAAIRATETCISVRGDKGWEFLHLILAMAHAKRGEPEKAREWFAKAQPGITEGSLADTPQWLVDEAVALLGGDVPPVPATKGRPGGAAGAK